MASLNLLKNRSIYYYIETFSYSHCFPFYVFYFCSHQFISFCFTVIFVFNFFQSVLLKLFLFYLLFWFLNFHNPIFCRSATIIFEHISFRICTLFHIFYFGCPFFFFYDIRLFSNCLLNKFLSDSFCNVILTFFE